MTAGTQLSTDHLVFISESRERLPNGWTRVVQKVFDKASRSHKLLSWYEKKVVADKHVDFVSVEQVKP